MLKYLLILPIVWYFTTPQKSLTLYYANWCPHCKELFPIFETLQVDGVKIRKIGEKFNFEYRVKGFPTIVYRDGSVIEEYRGARSYDAISQYLESFA